MQRVTLLLLIFTVKDFVRGDNLNIEYNCKFHERIIEVTLPANQIASCNVSISCGNGSYIDQNNNCSNQDVWISDMISSNEDLCNVTVLYETGPVNNASNGMIYADFTICTFASDLGLPMITLDCTTDIAMATRSINATWRLQSFLPTDIQAGRFNAVPDCNIRISCGNGHTVRNFACRKQYGWRFSNIPLTEQSCNVTISYDYSQDFNNMYHSNSANCSFPTITIEPEIQNITEDPIVGHPYEIQCIVEEVSIDFGNIKWIGPSGKAIMNNSRISITNTTVGNNHSSILQFACLIEADIGWYHCSVEKPYNITYDDSIMLENFMIPDASVSVTVVNQTIDEMLSLKCDVNIVKGITCSVYILWKINGINLTNYNGNVTENMTAYTYYYNDTEKLTSNNNNTMYQCQVIINNTLIGNDSVTLNLTNPTNSSNEISTIDPTNSSNETSSNPTPNETSSNATAISLISITIVLILVFIVVSIGICIYRTKRGKKPQELSRDYQLQPIDDSGVSVVGKDYPSTCESLGANQKVREWIKTFDMAEIDEERESVISATNEDMLDYVHGHTTKATQIADSGVDDTELDSSLSPSKQNIDVSQKAVEDMCYVKYDEINQPDHQDAVQGNHEESITADAINNGSYVDHYIASNDDDKILSPQHSTDETALIGTRNGNYIGNYVDQYTASVSQPLSNAEEQSYIDHNVTLNTDTSLHSNNESILTSGNYIDHNTTSNSMQPPFHSNATETAEEGSYIGRYIASINDNSEPLHASATFESVSAADGSYIDNDTAFSTDQALSNSSTTPTHVHIKDSVLSTESISDYTTESDV